MVLKTKSQGHPYWGWAFLFSRAWTGPLAAGKGVRKRRAEPTGLPGGPPFLFLARPAAQDLDISAAMRALHSPFATFTK